MKTLLNLILCWAVFFESSEFWKRTIWEKLARVKQPRTLAVATDGVTLFYCWWRLSWVESANASLPSLITDELFFVSSRPRRKCSCYWRWRGSWWWRFEALRVTASTGVTQMMKLQFSLVYFCMDSHPLAPPPWLQACQVSTSTDMRGRCRVVIIVLFISTIYKGSEKMASLHQDLRPSHQCFGEEPRIRQLYIWQKDSGVHCSIMTSPAISPQHNW